jgi:DNA mismatch repair protein MSH5
VSLASQAKTHQSQSLDDSEEDDFENEEEDLRNEVIMAIDVKEKGTIGCCYYEARDEKLCLMEDVKHGGLDFIESCKI